MLSHRIARQRVLISGPLEDVLERFNFASEFYNVKILFELLQTALLLSQLLLTPICQWHL